MAASLVRMPYIDSNIFKSIFYSALVDEFFRILRVLFYTNTLIKKLRNSLVKWKHRGYNPSGVKKALSNIIQRNEKAFANSLKKNVMKFFLNSTFKLDQIYYLTHDTLPTALSFCYIDFLRMTLCQQCSFLFFPFFFIDDIWGSHYWLTCT